MNRREFLRTGLLLGTTTGLPSSIRMANTGIGDTLPTIRQTHQFRAIFDDGTPELERIKKLLRWKSPCTPPNKIRNVTLWLHEDVGMPIHPYDISTYEGWKIIKQHLARDKSLVSITGGFLIHDVVNNGIGYCHATLLHIDNTSQFATDQEVYMVSLDNMMGTPPHLYKDIAKIKKYLLKGKAL